MHKKIFGFSGEWKQRRIDKCRAGRSGKGRCLAGNPRKLDMRDVWDLGNVGDALETRVVVQLLIRFYHIFSRRCK